MPQWTQVSLSKTRGSGAYNPSGNKLEVMIVIFVASDSWGKNSKIGNNSKIEISREKMFIVTNSSI